MSVLIINDLAGNKYSRLIVSELNKLDIKVRNCVSNEINLSTNFHIKEDVVLIRASPPILNIIKCLEGSGKKVINSSYTIERTTNKFLGCWVAKNVAKVPTPETRFYSESYRSMKLDNLKFPLIVKPQYSSGGRDVYKVNDLEELRKKLNNLDKSKCYLLQEFLEYDKIIRVVMIGNKIIDVAYETPKNEWKATVCANPNVKKYKVTNKLKNFSNKIKKAFRADILILDLFEKRSELIFNEINTACNFYPMQKATGINHAFYIAKYLSLFC